MPDFKFGYVLVSYNCFDGCTVVHQQSCACANVAPLAASETGALMDLYRGTGGAMWTDSTGWADYPASDPCVNLWFGVACSGGATFSGQPSHVRYVPLLLHSS